MFIIIIILLKRCNGIGLKIFTHTPFFSSSIDSLLFIKPPKGKGLLPHVETIMPIMVSTLATRSWAGKETVLDAFVRLCISCNEWWQTNPQAKPSLDDIAKVGCRTVSILFVSDLATLVY